MKTLQQFLESSNPRIPRKMERMVMVAMAVMVMAMVVTGMAVAMVDPTVVETEEE